LAYSISLFGQILGEIGKQRFTRLVQETGADKGAKGFRSWDQCVAMLFCQLAHCKSLREITDGLRVTCGKLNHLGLNAAPAKSTLSYANAHRTCELYEKLFYEMLGTASALSMGKKKRFRFKNRLFSLDATVIDLCLSLFPWAKFRQTKGAVKLHLLLDHDGYLPAFANMTEGKVHEVNIARTLSLPRGSIVAMDRGYFDFGLFEKWNSEGVFFVTRLKDNVQYDILDSFEVTAANAVLFDRAIRVDNQKYSHPLRLVVVWDVKNEREIELVTNNVQLCAATIAAIYKDRWEIELFFKCIKQNLKVKTFIGTSANALKVQIWTALIATLLLKMLQFKSKMNLALSRLVALLRLNLFSYRNLQDWLDDPFETPPEEPPYQLQLEFGTA